MWIVKKDKDLGYEICLNSCNCEEKPSNEIMRQLKAVSDKEMPAKNFIYSLPATMIRTFAFPDIDQKNHENLQNDETLCESCSSQKDNIVLYVVIRPKLQNYSTSNVNINKSISVGVEPPKTKITLQNPTGSGRLENYDDPHKTKTLDTSYNKASNDKPKNDFTGEIGGQYTWKKPCEIPVDSDLIASSNLSTNVPMNSRVCDICSTECESNICLSCNKEKVCEQNNSQTNDELSVPLVTNLSSETSSLEINTHHEINDCVTNEDDLHDNGKIAVRHNISSSNCILCKNHLNISEGFVLILCKHIFCEMCIKTQITLKLLDHKNVLPCCDRPIELDEIKYFLYNHEYKQFTASDIQQCFDKNCTGYYLWEECGEERPIMFMCNKCELENCLKCEAIHVNLTCGQYDKIRNSVDNETGEMLLTWIRDGIAMPCPKCAALIEKDEGCDWVQCLFCNTEICWATRGPRWGPNGKGDTSGGCGCDYEVKKCVENCNYCH